MAFSEPNVCSSRILSLSSARTAYLRSADRLSAIVFSAVVNCKKIVISWGICLTGRNSSDRLRVAPPLKRDLNGKSRISHTLPRRMIMSTKSLSPIRTGVSILFIVLTVMASFGFSQSATRKLSANNSNKMVGTARDLGPEDVSKRITVNIWLNLHNKSGLDKLVREMYQEGSANYHRWLTMEQYKASFAPAAHDAAVVREFLESHNLSVAAIDKNNHYVTAQGRVGDVQNAFNVQIDRFSVKGEIHRMATTEPKVAGAAGAVVAAVQVSDLGYSSYSRPAIDPDTGVAYSGVPVTSGPSSNGLFFSAECLRPPETQTFKTGGGAPIAVYAGNRYGANITSGAPNLPPCGYDSAEIQTAYGLNGLYSKGLNGAGQTIVIVDAFGSNTILSDANLFSGLNGLPALTPSNFQIYLPNGSATCTATNGCIAGNWQVRTTLDGGG